MSEFSLYVIIKMRDCMCLNALYTILLWWEILYFWMRFIWYYYNFRLYLSECALKDIIKMRACMCLNALYMVLLKWELVFVWTRFIFYYYDGRLYLSECAPKYIIKMRTCMSECPLYDINKMRAVFFWTLYIYIITMMGDFICLNALWKLL